MIYIGFLICAASFFLTYDYTPVSTDQKVGMFLISFGIGWIVCSMVHSLFRKK